MMAYILQNGKIDGKGIRYWHKAYVNEYNKNVQLGAELEERTDQYHLAHAKILSREAIIEDLGGELRVLRAMLDTAYHLRFVDDTSTHEEQMEFWKDVEKALKGGE
jgi:hypothetical protein